MAYPTAITTYLNPPVGTKLGDSGYNHRTIHGQIQDDLEGIETKLGVGLGTLLGQNILIADLYAGADLGAQIMAADTALGASRGEIWCFGTVSATVSTAVTLSARHVVKFWGGVFTLTGTITCAADGTGVLGHGMGNTLINCSSNTAKGITFGSATVLTRHHQFRDFSLIRTGTASAGNGAHGIFQASAGGSGGGIADECVIENVLVRNHDQGVLLGPSNASRFSHAFVDTNFSHGVHVQASSAVGPCQWHLDEILSAINDGDGFRCSTITGGPGSAQGDWKNCKTWSNTGYGISAIAASGVPINGLRIFIPFLGNDGGHGIYMDTANGSAHQVVGGYIEGQGTSSTGRTTSTGASSAASGIHITANNNVVRVSNVELMSNSRNGLYSEALALTATNVHALSNGVGLVAGNRVGLYLASSTSTRRAQLVNCLAYNRGSGTDQLYGAYMNHGNNTVVACNFEDENGNATAAMGGYDANTILLGNRPTTLGNTIPGATAHGTDIVVGRHRRSAGNAPTISSNGAAAGTGPTISIAGTDSSMILTVAVGTSPTADAVLCTIAFAATRDAAPRTVSIAPQNGSASRPGTAFGAYTDSYGTTTFQVIISGVLTASGTYKWILTPEG